MKRILHPLLAFILCATSAAGRADPIEQTFEFDCDVPGGKMSDWVGTIVPRLQHVRGSIELLEPRDHERWWPVASVFLFQGAKHVGFQLYRDRKRQDLLRFPAPQLSSSSRTYWCVPKDDPLAVIFDRVQRIVMGSHTFVVVAFLMIGIGVGNASASESAAANPDDPIEYTGCIRWGFEDVFFVPLPNTSREKWSIAAIPDGFRAMARGIPVVGHSRLMFARVYAKVGPEGSYGHLGMGSREIAISAIVELRQFEESDGTCEIWAPPPPVPPPEDG